MGSVVRSGFSLCSVTGKLMVVGLYASVPVALLLFWTGCGQSSPSSPTTASESVATVASETAPAPPETPPAASAALPPTPATTVRPAIVEPPDLDLFALAMRLRGGPGSLNRVADTGPAGSYQAGRTDTFWVTDLVDTSSRTIRATLRLVSEHAYWYVDDHLVIDLDDLREAARAFEDRVHPRIAESFGWIWTPGVDNDPRLTILHTRLNGAAGYFGAQDEYPRQVHPQSNEREIIYMDGAELTPGTPAYLGTLAHELQHAVHWNLDDGEDAWLNEGMSELARELAGYSSPFVDSFLAKSDTSLTNWPDAPEPTSPHYGAATLFLAYLVQHYGGFAGLGRLASEPADGVNGVDAYLAGHDTTFLAVYSDWLVANYLDLDEGLYGYPDRDVRVRDVERMTGYGQRERSLGQFAADYLELRLEPGDAIVRFQGDAVVQRLGTRCRGGERCWWSNRGDSIDSTLTREFDLSGVERATLEFWAWFNLEEDWDYAYLEVSTDGGGSWTILQTQHSTTNNPVGNSFGHGITGDSGGWVHERVDLTPYVGGSALVRFEYVTDDAIYLDGLVIDDISVPEIGFHDDAEQERGWRAEGFIRMDNTLPQDYVVKIIEEGSDGGVAVRDLALDDRRRGETLISGFGSHLAHAVLVVSPVTRGTHSQASYVLTVGEVAVP